MASFGGWRKPKNKDRSQTEQPYEAPINVRQIANLPYGTGNAQADYYEPMALTRADTLQDKSAMRVVVLLHDDPYEGTRYSVMPLAMEMARRGLAVYAVGLEARSADEGAFFLDQINGVFEFLEALAVDKHRLDLHCRTYSRDGNKVILMGCGSGAMLASVVLRLHLNARMREYFARLCPAVKRYFALGRTPTVDFHNLIRIEAFVSLSGNLCPQLEGNRRVYDRWLGAGFEKTMLYTYLDSTGWNSADCPPVLAVTSMADDTRKEAIAFAASLPDGVQRRVLDLPATDTEGHVLDALFSMHYPLWEKSKEVHSQIVSFCKNL